MAKIYLKFFLLVFIVTLILDTIFGLLLLWLAWDDGFYFMLVNMPILYVFPFNYLVVCTAEESILVWPFHMAILVGVVAVATKIAWQQLSKKYNRREKSTPD